MTVELPPDYKPSPDEDYMNPRQLEYFRLKLLKWREDLMQEAQETLNNLRDDSYKEVGDEADRASRESDHSLELRTRDRYRKLIRKIEQALERVEDGTYGYCEDTGEPIGVARLEARPIATLTVDAQERREMKEKVLADR
ncbi:MAG: RNA polymerase-binding protein DksA [Gammaproteobacteria bacterium]|jgi:DnaK suppressor protein